MGSSTAGCWAVCPAVVGEDVLHPASWSGLSVDADLMHSETSSEDNSIQCKMQAYIKNIDTYSFDLRKDVAKERLLDRPCSVCSAVSTGTLSTPGTGVGV